MVFSSPIFLFLFLPVTLGPYFLLPGRLRNVWLLGASLVFYGWGEPKFVVVMLASIVMNFLLALWIDRARGRGSARPALATAVVINIGLLVVLKYANFIVDNLNALLGGADLPPVVVPAIALPIGISFFTFQALSYVIDVYRRQAPVQKNPLNVGLYIALFPQLIAGPIVRYHDVARQIEDRAVTRSGFAYGIERFVVGLGKKVLIANSLAVPADLIFSIPGDQLTMAVAWLGVICYALQIYFDFSGYSDMAIGLGHMFGFRFLENFSHPYVAQSLTEFWRRWHISLSTWFRDYLYIPLGGSRGAPWRTYFNLVTVFFLCGLWHGASWNFVVWGLFHGAFLVIERMGLARWMSTWWRPFRHLYLLLVVTLSWVFFRAATLPEAWSFLRAMAGLSPASGLEHPIGLFLDAQVALALAIGAVGSMPVLAAIGRRLERSADAGAEVGTSVAKVAALASILALSSMLLAAGTYNPFI
jgi:alginate O-acetyltransferase complex protein AlgI